jgi:hypothetical protein
MAFPMSARASAKLARKRAPTRAPLYAPGTPRIWSPVKTRQPVSILAPGGRVTGLGQSYSPPAYFDSTWASVLVAGAEAIGCDPYDLAGLFINESGLNPSAANSIGCLGISQICPGSQGIFTSYYTPDQYTQLTISEQLPFVFAYVQQWMSQYNLLTISARDLYWLNFLPATYVPNAPDSYVISTQGDPWYSSNTSLDVTGSGTITAGDLYTAIQNAEANNPNLYGYAETWLTAAGGVLAIPPWTWLAAGSAVAGFAGFYAWKAGYLRGLRIPYLST